MNREERKEHAISHTSQMSEKYREEIKNSVQNSRIYTGDKIIAQDNRIENDPEIEIIDSTTEGAIKESGWCILNFASYLHPGGGFLKGSIAQEEAICHSSDLYNVLENFKGEYEKNYNSLNQSLYRDWAIYSPDIIFLDKYRENVITCAAPNVTRYYRENRSRKKYIESLKSRIKFILGIAEKEHQDKLILGAFGCGVFGNNPRTVASEFKDNLGKYNFKKVIFAIPGGPNLDEFRKVFRI